MKVNVKLAEDAVLPAYSKEDDAGLDFVTTGITMTTSKYVEYGTGVHIEIPEGHVGLVFPRSSISKYDLLLTNSVGVIDSNYRGEIRFRFKKLSNGANETVYNIGDKIGQLIIVPIPKVELNVVDELSDTERGSRGFGSSGD
jgi:dUTP pyrophosphatase